MSWILYLFLKTCLHNERRTFSKSNLNIYNRGFSSTCWTRFTLHTSQCIRRSIRRNRCAIQKYMFDLRFISFTQIKKHVRILPKFVQLLRISYHFQNLSKFNKFKYLKICNILILGYFTSSTLNLALFTADSNLSTQKSPLESICSMKVRGLYIF